MAISPLEPDSQTVTLSEYANKIFHEEDKPLFNEAIAAWKVGALRAAYVMIWLACAESLKFRFREAQKRDQSAGKIVGDIKAKEAGHEAVDKFVLGEALKYGFISNSGHAILEHIYQMRCLYGHPYEESPSQQQVSHAASSVIDLVLSQPVKLRKGFYAQLVKNFLENSSFLDDQQTAVIDFTKDVLPRIDERLYGALLDYYWQKLEKITNDPSLAIFSRRGIWFSCAMLSEVSVNIFSPDEWHNKFSKFPKILIQVCSEAWIFKEIGKRAQDFLVSFILAESNKRASVLNILEQLNHQNVLDSRQEERFADRISQLNLDGIKASELSTKTCYEKLIQAMKSYSWPTQNPAIDLIVSNGRNQVAELDVEQQLHLGRNLLQAAEGNANSALDFLLRLSKDGTSWPINVVRGIALELFTNESKQIRLKVRCLKAVLSALNHLQKNEQESIIDEIVASIDSGVPKAWVPMSDVENAICALNAYPQFKTLTAIIKNKVEPLSNVKTVYL